MKKYGFLKHPLVMAGLALGLLGLTTLLPDSTGQSEGIATFSLMRLALALVAILGLALGLVPLLRRIPQAGRKGGGRIRCQEQLALDPKHRLALISVDGRELLLGLQSDGFVMLADLKEEATLPRDLDNQAAAGLPEAEGDYFRQMLERQKRQS